MIEWNMDKKFVWHTPIKSNTSVFKGECAVQGKAFHPSWVEA